MFRQLFSDGCVLSKMVINEITCSGRPTCVPAAMSTLVISKQPFRNVHLTWNLYQKDEEDMGLKDDMIGKGDKVMSVKLPSLRIEAVVKAGLNISRNKVEKAFFNDRIRVNGERPGKKSSSLDEGDEVDLIKGPSRHNPEFLEVSRVELAKIKADQVDTSDDAEDYSIPCVLNVYKFLTVENYRQPWKRKTEVEDNN